LKHLKPCVRCPERPEQRTTSSAKLSTTTDRQLKEPRARSVSATTSLDPQPAESTRTQPEPQTYHKKGQSARAQSET
jgi:hypothetical protein